MTATRGLVVAHSCVGSLFALRPSSGARLLGYPQEGPAARAVLRVLGGRHLVQALVLFRGGPQVTAVGAAVDAAHALTCLAYAHQSLRGRRAGRRAAVLASVLSLAEARTASRPRGPAARA